MRSQKRWVFPILVAGLSLALASPALGQETGADLPSTTPKSKVIKKKKKTTPTSTRRSRKPVSPAAAKPTPPPLPATEKPAAPPAASSPAAPAASQTVAPPPLDLTAPPAAKKPAAPAGGLGLDMAIKGAAKQRMDAARRLFQEKSYETAALAYYEILRDPKLAEAYDEARYQLAKCLTRLKLYYSAMARFDEILSKGSQQSKYFHTALEWIFYIGRRTTNEQVIFTHLARFANESIPPAYQDKFNYLLSKYNFERGQALTEAGRTAEGKKSYEEARRLAALVRPQRLGGNLPAAGQDEEGLAEEEDVFPAARFLEGMVLYAQGNQPQALEAFKDVVRLTNPRKNASANKRLREIAFLQLARIHYEHKQNRYAIFYYGKMPWGEERWLEGLWESSYAHYRIGDYEKALGNLLTLHSPYFRDEFFPESHILKAIVYYENCRYPEARTILEKFNTIYEPVHTELARLTSQKGPTSTFFDFIEKTEKTTKPGDASIMRKIMKVAFTDKNIRRLNDSILEIEGELDVGLPARGSGFRTSALAKDLGDALRAQRKALVDEAGARARQKLEYEQDGLRELLEQALRIKIEVSRKEREALEGALAKGGGLYEVVRPYKYSVAVDDEHEYWPYEGEFWRDELGTYSYTLTKGCRDYLTTRPKTSP